MEDLSAGRFGEASAKLAKAAAEQQARARASSVGPWGQQVTRDDGTVAQEFSGPMYGASQSLIGQALRGMSSPMDFGQYNVGTGDEYRAKAIEGARGQLGEWLAPMRAAGSDADRQRLLSQGFAEGSPEFASQMAQGQGAYDDMTASAGNLAESMGGYGGELQAMDLQAKQQRLAEALRSRSLPMEQLGQMRGMLPGASQASQDDSVFRGAGMDVQNDLGEYWRQRQRNEEEAAAIRDAGLGVFGTAANVTGGLITAGLENQQREKQARKKSGGWA